MSIKRKLACVAITFSFVLLSQGPARSDADRNVGGRAHTKHVAPEPAVSPPSHSDVEAQLAGLPWSAPVGHRQPRAADLHLDAGLSPDQMTLQRENNAVDRKLTICRGC